MENHTLTALNAVKNKGNLSQTEKNRYWKYFVNRTDVYIEQMPNGSYKKQTGDLTPEILFGESTIAGYHLNSDNEIKWICFDIDVDKKVYSKPDFNLELLLPRLQEQAIAISTELKRMGMPYYTEFSGKKGYHIWIFLERPVKASIVRRHFESLLSYKKLYPDEINIEFFPKQDSITPGGYGNFVKPPLQKHQVTGQYSYFVDEEFGPINGLPEFETYTITPQNKQALKSFENEFRERTRQVIEDDDSPKLDFSDCRADEIKYLSSAVEFLRLKIQDRGTWIKCGLALSSLGEKGRDYFLRLSDNPNYPEDTADRINWQYDELLRNKKGRLNLSSIFYEAKSLGYEYPELEERPSKDENPYDTIVEMFNQDDQRDPNKLLGFPLKKFKSLAENVDGIQPGFYLLGAESNVGKTAVLTNLCLDALETNPDLQVMYFSLDDSLKYTIYRFLGILTGMGINEVKKPKLKPSLQPFLNSKRKVLLDYIKDNRLMLKDIESVSHIDQLENEIRKAKDLNNLIVFIDGLYNLEVSESNTIREENIERARKVKFLVDVYRVPIFTTGELRKKTQDQGKDKAPTIHDLMESSKYAYNANIVWMLYGKSEELRSSMPELTLEYAKNKLSSFKGIQKLIFERGTGTMNEQPLLANTLNKIASAPGSGEDI